MKTILAIVLALLSLALLQSCSKHCNPSCIQSKIDENKINPSSMIKQVDQYNYQGQKVYVFVEDETKMSDPGATVYTSNCSSICFIGGIAALTMCNGDNFYNTAVFQKTIWKR